MTHKQLRKEYVSLMKEEGFYEQRVPVTSVETILARYFVSVFLFIFVSFFALDYSSGEWNTKSDKFESYYGGVTKIQYSTRIPEKTKQLIANY